MTKFNLLKYIINLKFNEAWYVIDIESLMLIVSNFNLFNSIETPV